MPTNRNTALPRATEALRETVTRFFLEPARPDRERLLGLEFECLRVGTGDCRAAPSRGEDGPDPLVRRLAALYRPDGVEAETVVEAGDIALLKLGPLAFSLEPGGQIEISFAPLATPRAVAGELATFCARIEAMVVGTPYRVLYLGHQPVSMPEDIALRAKPRYAIMDRRLAAAGRLGRHMMRATAGLQVTLDYRDEAECVAMLRAALVMAPLVTAMFANSPLVGGKPSGYQSFRERAWWDTDPSRCGVPVALLAAGATLGDYADFALDAELWFVERGGELHEVPGRRSFRDLLLAGEELTLADFALHATTLFPAARLRGGVEVRSADCVGSDLASAFCAIQAAVLYDADLRDRASGLHPCRTPAAVRALHETAARDGIDGVTEDGYAVREGCEALLDLGREGLRRKVEAGIYEPGTEVLLAPLAEAVAAGRSPAAGVLARFEREGAVC